MKRRKQQVLDVVQYTIIASALFFQTKGLIYATDMFVYTTTALVYLGAAAIIILREMADEL